MPVKQTYKVSDLEKRLTMLNLQMYGKNNKQPSDINLQLSDKNSVTDLTYLKQDLSKIALLASIAIGAELFLFFSQLTSKIKFF